MLLYCQLKCEYHLLTIFLNKKMYIQIFQNTTWIKSISSNKVLQSVLDTFVVTCWKCLIKICSILLLLLICWIVILSTKYTLKKIITIIIIIRTFDCAITYESFLYHFENGYSRICLSDELYKIPWNMFTNYLMLL